MAVKDLSPAWTESLVESFLKNGDLGFRLSRGLTFYAGGPIDSSLELARC